MEVVWKRRVCLLKEVLTLKGASLRDVDSLTNQTIAADAQHLAELEVVLDVSTGDKQFAPVLGLIRLVAVRHAPTICEVKEQGLLTLVDGAAESVLIQIRTLELGGILCACGGDAYRLVLGRLN